MTSGLNRGNREARSGFTLTCVSNLGFGKYPTFSIGARAVFRQDQYEKWLRCPSGGDC